MTVKDEEVRRVCAWIEAHQDDDEWLAALPSQLARLVHNAEQRGARKFRAATIDLLEPAMSDDHFNYCAWVAALPLAGIGRYAERPKCEVESRHPGHSEPSR